MMISGQGWQRYTKDFEDGNVGFFSNNNIVVFMKYDHLRRKKLERKLKYDLSFQIAFN